MSQNLAKELSPRKWRSINTHNRYESERQKDLKTGSCPLCSEESIQDFKHWKILPNKYPYDAVAERHDLIQPKRHVAKFKLLTKEEVQELEQLKDTFLNQKYTYLIEAMPKNKSVPGHLHYHLIEPKTID